MNNQNFDTVFEQTKNQSEGKKLLLHMCCAPCATYCLTRVLKTFDVTLFFSNDNITDKTEWQKRLSEAERLVKIVNDGEFEALPKFPLKLHVKEFDNRRFFEAARGFEKEPEGGARCEKCFFLRLSDTFEYAEKHDFDFFGTTLTVSPYKNSKLLNELGYAIENGFSTAANKKKTLGSCDDPNALHIENSCDDGKTHVKWLPSDFKKHGGYNESVRLCAKYGIYRQHYCGCVFSLQTPSN